MYDLIDNYGRRLTTKTKLNDVLTLCLNTPHSKVQFQGKTIFCSADGWHPCNGYCLIEFLNKDKAQLNLF